MGETYATYLSLQEASYRLAIAGAVPSDTTIRRWMNDGIREAGTGRVVKLAGVKIGRRVLVDPESIELFMAARVHAIKDAELVTS